MMALDTIECSRKEGSSTSDDARTNNWMLTDMGELVVGQPRWLVQHCITNTDLADVMQHATYGQLPALERAQIHPFSDQECVVSDSPGMPCCIGIFGLNCFGERIDRS